MIDHGQPMTPEQALLIARVVIGALLAGLVAFAGVVFLIGDAEPDPADKLMLLTAAIVLAAGVVASALAGRLMPAFYRRAGRRYEDRLESAFFQTTLVRAAFLEGPGFLCLVVYLIDGEPLALAGAAVSFVLIAALFPTRAAWERFHTAVTGAEVKTYEPR